MTSEIITKEGYLTIDDIIGQLSEANPTSIIGNIVFPSHPINEPLEDYASKLGLKIVNTMDDTTDAPESEYLGYAFKVPGEEERHIDDYYILCKSADNFGKIIKKCTSQKQLPPHVIMITREKEKGMSFCADSAEIHNGRITSYKYKPMK